MVIEYKSKKVLSAFVHFAVLKSASVHSKKVQSTKVKKYKAEKTHDFSGTQSAPASIHTLLKIRTLANVSATKHSKMVIFTNESSVECLLIPIRKTDNPSVGVV